VADHDQLTVVVAQAEGLDGTGDVGLDAVELAKEAFADVVRASGAVARCQLVDLETADSTSALTSSAWLGSVPAKLTTGVVPSRSATKPNAPSY
jgi:hypothetical protein